MAIKNKPQKGNPKHSLQALLFSALLFSSLYQSKAFTDAFLVPKHYFLVFSAALSVLFLLLYILFQSKKLTYTLNWLDIAVGSFLVYCMLNQIFAVGNPLLEMKLLSLFVLTLVYFLYKPVLGQHHPWNGEMRFEITLTRVLILLGLLQAVFGLVQYFGVSKNLINEFRIGGAFGNPGPYANFLAAILPFSFFYAIKAPKNWLKYLAIASTLAVLIVLPFTAARTAWIAAIVSVLYMLLHLNPVVSLWTKYFAKWQARAALVVLIAFLVTIAAFQLSSFKQESASGRLFIYRVSLEMVKDKPITGHGFASFPAVHNNYQADYFRENPDDWENANLADGVNYAFNEYLQIAAETGLVGLLLFLLIPYFIFRNKRLAMADKSDLLLIGAEASVVAVLISSLFSYPLQDNATLIVFFISLMVISAKMRKAVYSFSFKSSHTRFLSLTGLILLFLFVRLSLVRFHAEKEWLKAFEMVRKGQHDKAKRSYEKLYPILKYNQFFLFNYGAELSVMQEYNRSVEVLEEVEHRLNDSDFYIYLGNSQENLGNLSGALASFEQAAFIVPIKFYPLYRQVLLHLKMGNIEKAKSMAQHIIDMPVKVNSDIIVSIKKEMEVFLQSN